MPNAAEFLKQYESTPATGDGSSAPSPKPAPEKKSAGAFLAGYGAKVTPKKKEAAPPPSNDDDAPGLATEMVEGFVDPIKESVQTIGEDYTTGQRQHASPQAEENYKHASLGSRAKTVGEGVLATAKLPLDAAGVVLSPVTGVVKAGATPVARVMHDMQPTVRGAHPEGYVSPYTDEHGQKHAATVLSPEELAKYKKQSAEQPGNMDYFKGPGNRNRPRPMLTGTTKEIATGLTEMTMDAAMMVVPEDVQAFRSGPKVGGAEEFGERAAGAGGEKIARPTSTFGNLTTRIGQTPKDFAKVKVGQALKKSGLTLEQAKEKVGKPGMSISDLGDDATLELGEQAAMSGEGRRLGTNLYGEERLKGRRGRVVEAVNQLANDKNMYEHIDDLKASQIATARPLYQKAFEGGSQAPLLANLEEHFNTTSKAVSDAAQELRDAENAVTMANARHVGETDNVYGTASRNTALRAANRRKLMAEEKLDQAKAAREAALDRLNLAQEHEEAGIQGGLWSPRLDELMQRGFVTSGMGRGIEIQLNEAAAKGASPSLYEYALKPGSNAENPVAAEVPNLRLLDAMKRGMDDHIHNTYWKEQTGKLELTELGKSQMELRTEFVKEVDRLADEAGNTSYKAAREAWSGPQGIIEATHDGMKFDNTAPELLAKKVAKMKPAELEGYRIGVSRVIANKVSEGPAAALRVARDIATDDYYQRQLKAVLTPEQYEHIVELADREVKFAERGSRIIGGSNTARLKEGSKDFDSFLGTAGDEVLGALQGRAGRYGDMNPHRLAMNIGSRWVADILSGMTEARRDAVAKMIFSTNKQDNLEALEMIYDEGMMTTPKYPMKKKIGAAAAAENENADRPRQEREQAEEDSKSVEDILK